MKRCTCLICRLSVKRSRAFAGNMLVTAHADVLMQTLRDAGIVLIGAIAREIAEPQIFHDGRPVAVRLLRQKRRVMHQAV